MKNERFYIVGAGQHERYRRSHLRKLSSESRLEEVYTKGVLLEVDFASKKIVRKLEMDRDEMDFTVDGYATNFTVPSRCDDTLYVPSHGCVYEIGLNDFSLQGQITNPLFNDLHQYIVKDDVHYAVSTGIDHVVVLDENHEAKELHPVHVGLPDLDEDVDYRLVNTKPHQSHPNYLFWNDDEPWVTRAKQHDCVSLNDLENGLPLADVMVHDGVCFEGLHYFTSVKGQIIVADLNHRKVIEVINLIHKNWHLLAGWCRGLYVTDDFYYVGYSVFRRTRYVENLQWVKAMLAGNEPPRPTRIEKIDRATHKVVDQFVFEPEDLNAIFWLSPVNEA